MILYLDVFFLVNAVMDGILLLLVRQILRWSVRKVNLAAAAAAGAAWACLAVVAVNGASSPPARVSQLLRALVLRIPASWVSVLWALALRGFWWMGGAVLMLRIAFGRRDMREFLQSVLWLLIISAAAGGAFAAMDGSGQWTLAGLLFCGVGIGFGGMAVAGWLRERFRIQKNLYEVVIGYQGNSVKVTALRDTGNQLYEPYGHQPVHVISQETARKLGDTVTGMIYIPFSAVGTERGMLPAIRADWMEVARDGTEKKRLDRPWLAISRETLSGTHQYQMLLHGESS